MFSLSLLANKQKVKTYEQKTIKWNKKFIKKTWNQFCVGHLFLGMGPALECGGQAQCPYNGGSRIFLSQFVSIANVFLVSNGILCLFPLLRDFVCFKPVQSLCSSYGHCEGTPLSALLYLEDCFLEVIHHLWLLQSFSHLFSIAP